MNLTDVDDRIIKNAVAHGHSLEEETAPWIAAFEEDRDTLGIRPAHHYPRATEYIDADGRPDRASRDAPARRIGPTAATTSTSRRFPPTAS